MSAAPATRVAIVEHKTTRKDISPGSTYWERLQLDDQISKYWQGVTALGYLPVEVIYDVIWNPSMRPFLATPEEKRQYTQEKSRACPECKKKKQAYGEPHYFRIAATTDEETGEVFEKTVLADSGAVGEYNLRCILGRITTDPGGKLYANMHEHDETPAAYADRLRADIAANPERYYQRNAIVRMAEEEREGQADTWQIARNLREAELSNRWPRNVDACDQYGRLCEYFPVCTKKTTVDDPVFFRDADTHEELDMPSENVKRSLPLVTSSSMKTFRSCQRKYYFSYVRKRRSIESSAAMRFGTLVHKALEVWWKSAANVDEALGAIIDYAMTRPEIDEFEIVKAEELIMGYHVMYRNRHFQVIEVEGEFAVPLVNPDTGAASKTYQLGGKLDALVLV